MYKIETFPDKNSFVFISSNEKFITENTRLSFLYVQCARTLGGKGAQFLCGQLRHVWRASVGRSCAASLSFFKAYLFSFSQKAFLCELYSLPSLHFPVLSDKYMLLPFFFFGGTTARTNALYRTIKKNFKHFDELNFSWFLKFNFFEK